MLDYFGIFTRGGALLWTLQFTAMRHSPVEALNALIRSCLLEERSGVNTFTYVPKTGAHQALKWTFHNVSEDWGAQGSCRASPGPPCSMHHGDLVLKRLARGI